MNTIYRVIWNHTLGVYLVSSSGEVNVSGNHSTRYPVQWQYWLWLVWKCKFACFLLNRTIKVYALIVHHLCADR